MKNLRIRIMYRFKRVLTQLFVLAVYDRKVFSRRAAAAWMYIGGKKNGIEIGAAGNPLLSRGI